MPWNSRLVWSGTYRESCGHVCVAVVNPANKARIWTWGYVWMCNSARDGHCVRLVYDLRLERIETGWLEWMDRDCGD